MHPRTQEILHHLDTHRAGLERALADVPPSLRDQRPATGGWSIAQILEHLAVVEGRVISVLDGHLDAVRELGPDPETGPVVPTVDMALVLDRSQPLTASEASQPREGLNAPEAWARLADRRRALREKVLAADGLALGSVRATHPRLGDLNLYQWLVFVGGHEARHTEQLREVAASLRGG